MRTFVPRRFWVEWWLCCSIIDSSPKRICIFVIEWHGKVQRLRTKEKLKTRACNIYWHLYINTLTQKNTENASTPLVLNCADIALTSFFTILVPPDWGGGGGLEHPESYFGNGCEPPTPSSTIHCTPHIFVIPHLRIPPPIFSPWSFHNFGG